MMKKTMIKKLLIMLLTLLPVAVQAQVAVGGWTLYSAFNPVGITTAYSPTPMGRALWLLMPRAILTVYMTMAKL